jgi:hypothetical protein
MKSKMHPSDAMVAEAELASASMQSCGQAGKTPVFRADRGAEKCRLN